MIDQEAGRLQSRSYHLLFRIIILFVLLQSLFIIGKKNFVADENYSYLVASGKMSNYINIFEGREFPYGQLVEVKQYKDLLKIDKLFSFGKIAKDAGYYDMHPPLYYWLLHGWLSITGDYAGVIAGSLLNLILLMLILLVLFKLAFELFGSYNESLVCVLLFSLTPTVHKLNYARPYILLTLITIFLSFLLVVFIKSERKITLFKIITFSVLVCLGFLCHYTFGIICFSWFMYFLVTYWKGQKALIFCFVASCLIGFLLFSVIFPYFIFNLTNYDVLFDQTFTDVGLLSFHQKPIDLKISKIIVQRLGAFLSLHQKTLIASLLNSWELVYYFLISVIASCYLLIWFSVKKNSLFRFVYATFFYPVLILSLIFLSKKSLPWLVHEKYLLSVLAFFYLAIVMFIKTKFFDYKKIILICLCQILIFATVDNLIVESVASKRLHDRVVLFLARFENNQESVKEKSVVLDNSILQGNGILRIFRVLNRLPEDTKIVIADASFLLSNYSNYFGEDSALFPFVFITFSNNFAKGETGASNLLLQRFEDDGNIKISYDAHFANVANAGEIIYEIERE